MEIVVQYLPVILFAARSTFMLFIGAALAGAVAGLIIAVARSSKNPLLRVPAQLFIAVVQGTPVLLQLFVVHYGLAIFGVRIPPLVSATIALAIFSAGFLGEIWRGAIDAVPSTQWDAARSLGFGRMQALLSLIAPQALWIALPATVGFAVSLLKSTSLASIIGITELTKTGVMVANISFEPMLVYGLVAALYFLMCWPMSVLSRSLEKRQNASR